jgi:uncharacterized phage-associated protein
MTSKKFPFNKEKALNTVLYIAKHVNRSDFHKIFKILYFSDRTYLADYGMPITGDRYIAMDIGPVPSKIYDIFKIVRGDSSMTDKENFGDLFSVEGWMYIKAKKDPDLKKLSPNEKEVIDSCIKQYGNLSYDEIKEKSHDIAWRSTPRDFEIDIYQIAREAGVDDDEFNYIDELRNIKNVLC